MKKALLLKAMLLLCALIVGSGTMWADYEVVYTLDGTVTGGTNGYAEASAITQNEMDWSVVGNTTQNPWRIGGKSLEEVDRDITGNTAFSEAINKITFNHAGTTSDKLIVNSVKLTVASDADFSSVIDEVTLTPTISKNTEGSFDYTPTTPLTEWATGSYYKFTINVSNDNSSNYGFCPTSIVFYKESTKTATTTTIDVSGITNTYINVSTEAGQLTATVTAGGNAVADASVSWSSSNENVATINANGIVTLLAEGTTTIKASYAGNEDYSASSDTYELTVTDSRADAGLAYAEASQTVGIGETLNAPELTNPNNLTITYSSSDEAIATVDAEGNVTGIAIGTATITATFAGNDSYKSGSASYTLKVKKAAPSGALFYESMSGYTGTSDVSSSLSTTYANLDSDEWNSFSSVYAGRVLSGDSDGHLKFGSGSSVGKAVTNAIVLTGEGKLTYKVQQYDSKNAGNLKISVSGATASGDVDVTGTAAWVEKTVDLTDATGSVVITFETTSDDKRIRVDDILLVAETRLDPELAFSQTEVSINFGEEFTAPTLSKAEGVGEVEYSSSNENVAQVIDSETGELRIVGGGTTVITATFAGDANFKRGSASYTLTVTDNRIATTITQEDIVIDLADVATLTMLTPVVKDANGIDIAYTNSPTAEGLPEVFFEIVGEDTDGILGSFDSHGNIVLNSVIGTATIKAVYNQFQTNTTYKSSECTFTITVADLNSPGSQNNPYTVAQAIEFINTLGTSTSTNDVYVSGIVSQVDSYFSSYSSITYWISDDGTTANQMEVYSGLGLNGANFSSKDDLQIGDKVTVKGKVKMYNNTPEFDKNSELVSLQRVEKPATPTFNPEAGTFTSIQTVAISTTTEGATIYYTTDGTEPTAESTEYTEAITVNTTMTIKAIAVKDGVWSAVAEATYTIDLTPSIVFDGQQNPINETSEAGSTNIHYVASNLTGNISLVICDAEGNATTYDWFSAELNGETSVAVAWQANDDTENARTSYFYLTDGTTSSDIFTFTQAKYVVDYATLPFSWAGGSSADLKELNGVTTNGLGSDYASSNSPYLVKFDTDGDYIQIKTDGQPGEVTIDVKMVGGSATSTITVQGSADGETFTDVETLTISGSQNSILNLVTTNAFDATYRYVRLYFNKGTGSNVGVGPITITKYGVVTNIAINDTNFPDEKFREFLLEQTYGTDGKLTEAEIAEITSLDLSNKGIVVLTGISYFTALKDLNVSYNIIPGDNLAEALPTIDGGRILVMDNTSESEGNTLDAAQANAIKEKGWTPVVISAFGSSSGLKGDVNSDGKVDIADVTNVINIINGKD